MKNILRKISLIGTDSDMYRGGNNFPVYLVYFFGVRSFDSFCLFYFICTLLKLLTLIFFTQYLWGLKFLLWLWGALIFLLMGGGVLWVTEMRGWRGKTGCFSRITSHGVGEIRLPRGLRFDTKEELKNVPPEQVNV